MIKLRGKLALAARVPLCGVLEDTQYELLGGAGPAGVLGLTPVTLRLLASLAPAGLDRAVESVYTPAVPSACPPLPVPVRPFDALREADCGVLVVAADAEKEDLLCAALPFISGTPKVIVAGYGHLGFRDRTFDEEQAARLASNPTNPEYHPSASIAPSTLGPSRSNEVTSYVWYSTRRE